MGLNLETLVGILVILILLILADGVRRVLRGRGRRLRVRLDPAVRRLADEPDVAERNPELASPVRVVRPGGAAHPTRGEFEEMDQGPGASDRPPVVMEKEEDGAAPPPAAQPDLFESPAEDEHPAPDDLLEVIVIHMVSSQGTRMPGRELLQRLLEQGLRFGEMNIFHRHSQAGGRSELQFSMANALEPGTFDIDAMEEQNFRAVTFFMKLPGPTRPAAALERMLSVARKLAESLSAELRDEQQSILTPQTVEHLRQRVQDFERRQRLNHAR